MIEFARNLLFVAMVLVAIYGFAVFVVPWLQKRFPPPPNDRFPGDW